ncbi:MAG: hypothetical protein ACI81L_002882 [Verrucomicrobiales bacterium]|jgi:hypothetical protein
MFQNNSTTQRSKRDLRETNVTYRDRTCVPEGQHVARQDVGFVARSAMLRDMSHSVEPNDLAEVATDYGTTPFLLYSAADGSARVNHVAVAVESEPAIVRVRGFGRGVGPRLDAGVSLSLLWPQHDPHGFSLIADGDGRIDGEELVINVTAAVLHRPAPADSPPSC